MLPFFFSAKTKPILVDVYKITVSNVPKKQKDRSQLIPQKKFTFGTFSIKIKYLQNALS
jgi:hypothetical protein